MVSPLAKYKLVRAVPVRGQSGRASVPSRLISSYPSSQVFLGDQSVGKTSIITRFMYDKFDNTYQVPQIPEPPRPTPNPPPLDTTPRFGHRRFGKRCAIYARTLVPSSVTGRTRCVGNDWH